MATLNIKNLPDVLYKKLRARAKREHRSVAQEVIHLLSRATEEGRHLSILELRGLGKECWQGVDPATHVAEERRSWDCGGYGCEDGSCNRALLSCKTDSISAT